MAALTAIFGQEQPVATIIDLHSTLAELDVDKRIERATSLRNTPGGTESFEWRLLTHTLAAQCFEDFDFSARQPLETMLEARAASGAPLTRLERFALVDLHDYERLAELNQLDVACHRSLSPTELTPQLAAERKAVRDRLYERLQAAREDGYKLAAKNELLLTGLQLEKVHESLNAGVSLPPKLDDSQIVYLAQIVVDVRAAGIDIPFDVLATSPEVVALYTRLHYRLQPTDVVRANLLKFSITAHREPTRSTDESITLPRKMKALRSNLYRDHAWSAGDWQWTVQRAGDPALSYWHHPLLLKIAKSQDIGAIVYDLVARAIGRVVGDDEAAEYVRHPMIWSALYLLGEGVPAATVQDATLYRLKDWRQARDLWHVLDAVREDAAVRAAVGVALDMGLGTFFSQGWPAFSEASASELKVAELVIKGAHLVWDTKAQGRDLAVDNGQRFGMEDEFVAAPSLPDRIDFRTELVDTIYSRVEQALRDAGLTVTTGHFDTDFFHLLPTTKWLAAEYWTFQSAATGDLAARSVRYLLLRGTGATMVFEYQLDANGRPQKTTKYETAHEDDKAGGIALTQARLDMQQLASKLLSVKPSSIDDLMQSRDPKREEEGVRRETGTVLMTKDKQGEIPQALVTFNANGTARVVGLNFRFNNPDGEPLESLVLTATTAVEVQYQLGDRIKHDPSFYLMTNRKSGLKIAGIAKALRVIDEQHLINEVVTQPLTLDQTVVIEAVVQGLSLAGYPSTSDHTAAGRHVHAEVKEPRELLTVMRDYAKDEDAILAFWHPNPVRLAFIQPLPDRLKQRLALKGYADVTTDSGKLLQPAERKELAWQELCRWADVAVETPPKYSGANADNYIALRVRELILGEQDNAGNWVVHPVLKDGDTATISDFYGRTYRFTVRKQLATDIDGKTFWDYGVTVRYRDEEGEEKNYPVNRVPGNLVKSTFEMRIFNTSSADRDDRGPVLDPAAAVLSVEFWASYVASRRFGGAFVQ